MNKFASNITISRIMLLSKLSEKSFDNVIDYLLPPYVHSLIFMLMEPSTELDYIKDEIQKIVAEHGVAGLCQAVSWAIEFRLEVLHYLCTEIKFTQQELLISSADFWEEGPGFNEEAAKILVNAGITRDAVITHMQSLWPPRDFHVRLNELVRFYNRIENAIVGVQTVCSMLNVNDMSPVYDILQKNALCIA